MIGYQNSTRPLTILPIEIGNCEKLFRLDLQNNQLTTLPKEIGNCKNLESLFLKNNQLTTIPESIKNTEGLILNITGNPCSKN